MNSKAARARKNDGQEIGDRAVEIPTLQCRIALHCTLKRHELHLDALFRKIAMFCGDDERNGVGIGHESDLDFGELRIFRL